MFTTIPSTLVSAAVNNPVTKELALYGTKLKSSLGDLSNNIAHAGHSSHRSVSESSGTTGTFSSWAHAAIPSGAVSLVTASATRRRSSNISWRDNGKFNAILEIEAALDQEEAKLSETKKLLRRTREFIRDRLLRRQKVGLIVSMKQQLKHEAQKERSDLVIESLNELLNKVEKSEVPVPYEHELAAILDTPVQIFYLEDEGDILAAAQRRLDTLDDAAPKRRIESRAA